MNRKQKQMLRQQQTTRQLMGIRRLTTHGVTVGSEELIFFLIYPENLSVLSLETIGQRVRAFTALLKANPDTELLALDSQETFRQNREFYRARLEEETNPALRELLRQDLSHLDSVQSAAATAREFVLIERLDEKSAADESGLRQREKSLSGYLTLYPEDWQAHSYVACCGTSAIPVLSMLERMSAPEEVYLCLDNDQAGEKGSLRMAEQIAEQFNIASDRLLPEHKDWNDDLCAGNQEQETMTIGGQA